MDLTIGVDVGGTKIAAGVVDQQGTVLDRVRVHTPAVTEEAVDEGIVDAVLDLVERHAVIGVGVAAAGFVDARRSAVRFAPNLPWRDHPLRDLLTARIGLPVVIENDANAAAWGEFRFGAGADTQDMILVTVGTGIGGGIVLDGRLLRGAWGVAAEIGHIQMVPNGRPCGCGNRGCWEQYASGTALLRDVRAAVGADPAAGRTLLELAGGSLERIDGPSVTRAAVAGDLLAVSALAAARRLAGARASPTWPHVWTQRWWWSAAGSARRATCCSDRPGRRSSGSSPPAATARTWPSGPPPSAMTQG